MRAGRGRPPMAAAIASRQPAGRIQRSVCIYLLGADVAAASCSKSHGLRKSCESKWASGAAQRQGTGMEMAGARVRGQGARHTLLQRQLELTAAFSAAERPSSKKDGWCCRAARSRGDGLVEVEAEFRSPRSCTGAVRAASRVSRLGRAVLSHGRSASRE